MSRTEQQMEEELKGLAALPAENTPMEDATPMEEKEPSIDMETMMGNFMDMSDQERQIVGRLIASPAGQLIDQVFGEPLIARLATQLDESFTLGDEEATPAPTEGMMAPEATTMAQGGMLNAQMRDMVRQGMSPQQIRNKMR